MIKKRSAKDRTAADWYMLLKQPAAGGENLAWEILSSNQSTYTYVLVSIQNKLVQLIRKIHENPFH